MRVPRTVATTVETNAMSRLFVSEFGKPGQSSGWSQP